MGDLRRYRQAVDLGGCTYDERGRLMIVVILAKPKYWHAAFAIKKGFYTARAGRPDAYRAGTDSDAQAVLLPIASLT